MEKNTKEELELIKKARLGDQEAYFLLFNKYNYLIKSLSRRYYLIGYDLEDLSQEGMIGFLGAITSFDEKKDTSFSTLAYICVKRAIIDAIKKNNSQKHGSDCVNFNVDFQGVVCDENKQKTVLMSKIPLPDENVIFKENLSELVVYINQNLSKLENEVLDLFLKGLSYKEIAETLKKDESCVENALSRLRKKLLNYFNN